MLFWNKLNALDRTETFAKQHEESAGLKSLFLQPKFFFIVCKANSTEYGVGGMFQYYICLAHWNVCESDDPFFAQTWNFFLLFSSPYVRTCVNAKTSIVPVS